MSTNSLGFRDRECSTVQLALETPRMVLIGDSFLEGVGVDFEESLAGLVQVGLRPRGIDVLNAGVNSYCPIIYYRKIKYLIEELELSFDQLVVFIDLSDAEQETHYRFDSLGNVTKLGGETKSTAPTPWLRKWLRDNTMSLGGLAFAVRNGLNPYRPARGQYLALWTVDDALFAEYAREGLNRMRLHMGMLDDLLDKYGIQLTVVVYPWPDQILLGDLDSRHVEYWRNWSDERGARFVNLFPAFVSATGSDASATVKQYFINGDVHWNEAGHRLAAENFLHALELDAAPTAEPSRSSDD